MTQEQKELLLKDLSARLPYGVLIQEDYLVDDEMFLPDEETDRLINIDVSDGTLMTNGGSFYHIDEIKPYLFPMYSMTKKQKRDLLLTVVGKEGLKLFSVTKDGIVSNDKEEQSIESFYFNNINFSNETTEAYIDWLNKNHFDYRGLIEKELAIDATNLKIY